MQLMEFYKKNMFNIDKLAGREPIGDEEARCFLSPFYTQKVIDKYHKAGIYCIHIDNKILYVGKSVNMHERLKQHIKAIKNPEGQTRKYQLLNDIIASGNSISFDVLYYSKKKRRDAVNRELKEREAYYINYYLPPLNKQIPEHPKFKKQSSLLDQIEDYKQAIKLAKKRSR